MRRMSCGRWALVVGAVMLVAELSFGPTNSWLGTTYLLAQGETSPNLSAITDARLRAHVKFLAGDLLEGRAPATRGGHLAANYIATEFKLLGLAPGSGDGSYFQMVTTVESRTDAGKGLTISGGAGTPEVLTPSADTVVGTAVEDPDVNVDADLVFLGYGINAPEQKWNDYEGVDVRGKVVMIMVNDPPATASEPNLFGGKALTYYGRWTYKYEEAARQGAAGALLIHTTESASYPWTVLQNAGSGARYSLPVEPGQPTLRLEAWVTDAAATRIAAKAGKDLAELRRAASMRGFTAVPLGLRVGATLHQTSARKQSPNVIGVLTGTNTSQAVLYTAHYDHFGIRDPKPDDPPTADRIFNGAVDNASGVAGILTIAQAFAQARTKPGRSVYFVATTLEESGLLGSEYLARHPMVPVNQLSADINVDSINVDGATSDMAVLGTERSTLGPMLAAIVKLQGRTLTGDVQPGAGHFFRSDHFPLAKAGVPAVSISDPEHYIGKGPAFAKKQRDDYTNNRYHQPSDEYSDSWDLAGAISDLKALAMLGWQVAAAPQMPRYNPDEQFAAPRLAR
jgi:Zn-dependent M28 family amino/carboxypeptidase